MELIEARGMASRQANTDWFTGTVWMEDLAKDARPDGVVMVRVSFEPGARTAWHTHPLGQVLYVLSGRGRAGTEGGRTIELAAGDIVRFAPGEKHWHGAAPDSLMTHLAIQETDGERNVTWMEKVSDREYGI